MRLHTINCYYLSTINKNYTFLKTFGVNKKEIPQNHCEIISELYTTSIMRTNSHLRLCGVY
jgi:hypothetical protein